MIETLGVLSKMKRKLNKSHFVLLYVALMTVVFGAWLVLFQNGLDLAQFQGAEVLGDILLILGVLTCFVSGILIQKELNSTEK
jgi:hypothetical protein